MPSRGLGYGGRKTRPPLRSARELERWTSAEPQSLAGTGLAPGARAAGAAVASWNTRAVEGTGCPPELVRIEGVGARVRAQHQQASVLARSSNGARGGTYPRRADAGRPSVYKALEGGVHADSGVNEWFEEGGAGAVMRGARAARGEGVAPDSACGDHLGMRKHFLAASRRGAAPDSHRHPRRMGEALRGRSERESARTGSAERSRRSRTQSAGRRCFGVAELAMGSAPAGGVAPL
ncbi:hypothetical protein B0H14DRAFT_2641023 [Mycena olivaceomarginata]|nr:hypothetical protein B0H14DRAFT_2641023 [Mycena olivaceomarginata]